MAESSWAPPIAQVQTKLSRCCVKLTCQSHVSFSSITKQLREKRDLLCQAEQDSVRGGGGDHECVKNLRYEINNLLLQKRRM